MVELKSVSAGSLPEKRLNADYAAIVANGIVLKAIAFGELLTRTKNKDVGYGLWGSWLAANCKFSERTAQRYMDLAAKKNKLPLSDPTRMSDLSLNQAFRLVAERAAKKSPSYTRGFDKAVKALLENLWKLEPRKAEYKANGATRQIQELLQKLQSEPERKEPERKAA
jgi:hypothetical protein